MVVAGASQPLVDSFVRQTIGFAVAFAGDVFETHPAESPHQRASLGVQPHQRRVLDAPTPRELLDQELAVGSEQDLLRPQVRRRSKGRDGCAVLGDVVGRDADAFADLLDHSAAGPRDHDADPRRPRVPAGRPVAVGDQSKTRILRQYSHLRMPCVRFSWSRYRGESF